MTRIRAGALQLIAAASLLGAIAAVTFRLSVREPKSDVPNHEASFFEEGPQILVVFLANSFCMATRTDEFRLTMRDFHDLLQQKRSNERLRITTLGVALDWSPRLGQEYLSYLGPFDQVSIGANWANENAFKYIWSDSSNPPAIPRVIVVERTLRRTRDRFYHVNERIAAQVIGDSAIVKWVQSGMPLALGSSPIRRVRKQ